MLRQAAHEDPDSIGAIHLGDAGCGQNVDHAGCEAAVGYDRNGSGLGGGGHLELTKDDLRIAAEIAAVLPRVERDRRDPVVEVVRQRVHDGVRPVHHRAYRDAVVGIDTDPLESRVVPVRLEVSRQTGVQIREQHELDVGVLQQVVGTGGALQATAQNEHSHRVAVLSKESRRTRRRTVRRGDRSRPEPSGRGEARPAGSLVRVRSRCQREPAGRPREISCHLRQYACQQRLGVIGAHLDRLTG
jgi:hypothetical protein